MTTFYLIALQLVGLIASPSGQDAGHIEWTDCFLEDCSRLAETPSVEFGYLTVPADYNEPDGRQVSVAFAVIKSREPQPEPDPVILFAGGWGISSLETLFSTAENFPVKNRDLILYDYRGSGYSEPALCPDLGEELWEILRADLGYEEFFARVNARSYACLEAIERRGLDYRHYGTAVKTKDAVVLAEKLGYGEVNLFGISNGTMGIQGFLKAAAGSPVRVRSILSDSNVPMAAFNRAEITADYKRVLDSLLEDCAESPSCNEAFPGLRERFHAFITDPGFTPVAYQGGESLVLNRYEINSLIQQLLYSSQTYKDIPMLLEAIMEGRMQFMDQLYQPLKERVAGLNGTSIINFEYDWKFTQQAVRETYRESHRGIAGFALADFWIDFALSDTTLSYHPEDTVAVTSEVPALLLAGTYDPITPPSLSEIMHQRYANSHLFIFPRIGHGVMGHPCGKELYLQFLENPAERPAGGCVEELAEAEIPFTTSYIPNQKASGLLIGIVQHRDILLILALALPLLLSLALLIREVVMWFRKKAADAWILALSGSILLFIAALGYYLYQTVSQGGLFILLGLTGGAAWLPWMAMVIALLALVLLMKTVRSRENLLRNTAALLSAALVVWLAIRFDFFLF